MCTPVDWMRTSNTGAVRTRWWPRALTLRFLEWTVNYTRLTMRTVLWPRTLTLRFLE